jgi:putative FmdB family regulatory protein
LPTYEYRCRNGHVFEVVQRMSDDPVAECEVCSEPVERVFHPVAVHFKGSGFYSTDYGRNRGGGGSDSSGGSESGGGKDDSKKETTTSKTDGRSDGGSSSSGTSDSKSGSSSD